MSADNPADLFKVVRRLRRHELEMMRDRGYDLSEKDTSILDWEVPASLRNQAQFIEWMKNTLRQRGLTERAGWVYSLDDVYRHRETGHLTAILHVPSSPTSKEIGVEAMRRLLLDVDPNVSEHPLIRQADGTRVQLNSVIFVFGAPLSSTSRTLLKDFRGLPYQVFSFDDLMFNPTHYVLSPTYEHITDPAVIREKIGRNKFSELQRMLVTDAVAMYYGAKPGDLFVETHSSAAFPQVTTLQTLLRAVVPA